MDRKTGPASGEGTKYVLRGDSLQHVEGAHGGPRFVIDWENRRILHNGTEVPEEAPPDSPTRGPRIVQEGPSERTEFEEAMREQTRFRAADGKPTPKEAQYTHSALGKASEHEKGQIPQVPIAESFPGAPYEEAALLQKGGGIDEQAKKLGIKLSTHVSAEPEIRPLGNQEYHAARRQFKESVMQSEQQESIDAMKRSEAAERVGNSPDAQDTHEGREQQFAAVEGTSPSAMTLEQIKAHEEEQKKLEEQRKAQAEQEQKQAVSKGQSVENQGTSSGSGAGAPATGNLFKGMK